MQIKVFMETLLETVCCSASCTRHRLVMTMWNSKLRRGGFISLLLQGYKAPVSLYWFPLALEESKSPFQNHPQVKEKTSSKGRGRLSGELFPSAPAKHSSELPGWRRGTARLQFFPALELQSETELFSCGIREGVKASHTSLVLSTIPSPWWCRSQKMNGWCQGCM